MKWEIENGNLFFIFFSDVLFIMRTIYMFLAVTIDIYVLFLIPSEAKFKERNELMIGKEVTLTFFVVTI